MNLYNISGADMFFSNVTKKQSKKLTKMITEFWREIDYWKCSGTITTNWNKKNFTITYMFDKDIVRDMEEQLAALDQNQQFGEAICRQLHAAYGIKFNCEGSEFYVGMTGSDSDELCKAITEEMKVLYG